MAASSEYSTKELEGKKGSDKQDMLMEKGINWNDYKTKYKRGTIIKKHVYALDIETGGLDDNPPTEPVKRSKWIPVETPIFTQDKEFLHNLIPVIEI